MIYNLLAVSLIAADDSVLKHGDDSMPSSNQVDQESESKMFFWPIWTKSAMPLPKDLKRRLDEETSNADSENKMFFWPIWTKSDMPIPSEVDEASENKMFFWPIWTKSDMPIPSEVDEASENKMFFWPIWTKSAM